MTVLVSDTSVLIDVQRAGLIERLFDLPYQFVVPDLLYERELKDWIGPDLVLLGLRVEELSKEEVIQATQLRRDRPALSLPDVFAFCLASQRNWMLLTGDGALRAEALRQTLAMHGVLWLFDELLDKEICVPAVLYDGLILIRDHPRCRLPMREINQRLGRYS